MPKKLNMFMQRAQMLSFSRAMSPIDSLRDGDCGQKPLRLKSRVKLESLLGPVSIPSQDFENVSLGNLGFGVKNTPVVEQMGIQSRLYFRSVLGTKISVDLLMILSDFNIQEKC